MSDGSLAQPKQARLTATFGGASPSSAAAGAAAAASLASISALSTVSASRTSLLPAPRSGCCSRSLASSGLGPSSGSASHSPRTASRRPSAMRRGQRDPHSASSLGRHSAYPPRDARCFFSDSACVGWQRPDVA
eukprot:scaffold65324_cov54-Phaeocystis_antarctica.AAC.4